MIILEQLESCTTIVRVSERERESITCSESTNRIHVVGIHQVVCEGHLILADACLSGAMMWAVSTLNRTVVWGAKLSFAEGHSVEMWQAAMQPPKDASYLSLQLYYT